MSTVPTAAMGTAAKSSLPRSPPKSTLARTDNKTDRLEYRGKTYMYIREGLASVLVPAKLSSAQGADSREKTQPQPVFYNPIQQFNRDLSVLVIKTFGELNQQAKHSKRQRREPNRSKKRKRGGENPAAHHAGDTAKEISTHEETSLLPGDSEPRHNTLENLNGELAIAAPSSGPRFRILDALSATGLRALRYSLEIPFTTSVTANDLSAAAVDAIKVNVDYNDLQCKINVNNGNALTHMYSCIDPGPPLIAGGHPVSRKYDVIDLDPYGSAASFLDAAVQAVSDGGLLCVTCTDAGVFASHAYPEKAFALYGGVPLKGQFSHEAGLRLILHAIAASASKYGAAIEPLLSLSIDFYARVFVRVERSPAAVKFLSGKSMMVYNCDQGCGAWSTQLLSRTKRMENAEGSVYYKHGLAQGPSISESCTHCGFKTHIAGPMYGGPIHSPAFIQKVIENAEDADEQIYGTKKRVLGMLQTALEENLSWHGADPNAQTVFSGRSLDEIDATPFFFVPNMVAKVLHARTPTENELRGAFIGLGYSVTRSHCKPGSLKTNAPWAVIWHIFREWVRQKAPLKEGSLSVNSAGAAILAKSVDENGKSNKFYARSSLEPQSEPAHASGNEEEVGVTFDEAIGRRHEQKYVRYQHNPRANWGPLSRAR